ASQGSTLSPSVGQGQGSTVGPRLAREADDDVRVRADRGPVVGVGQVADPGLEPPAVVQAVHAEAGVHEAVVLDLETWIALEIGVAVVLPAGVDRRLQAEVTVELAAVESRDRPGPLRAVEEGPAVEI